MTERLSFKTTMEFAYGVPAPIAPGIVRVVANNPGPLTFKGTNSYLVGMTELAVIDPGPDDEAHIAAILRAAGNRPITHIVLTHAHRDHVDGAARLKAATGARVCAFPRSRVVEKRSIHPAQTEYVNRDLAIDVILADTEVIEGRDWALQALHTPGHAPDHLCFALLKRDVVFSGDHVMAWNTTVVGPPEGSMSAYLRSLERLLARTRDKIYMPGHGGRLDRPRRTVRAYLLHRRWREQSILAVIRENGSATIPMIVQNVYSGLAPTLVPAAALSVLGHVEHLIEQGFVSCEEDVPTFDRPLYPASARL